MSSGRKFIGLDVHKDSIAIAIAEADMKEVRFFGTVCGTTEALHAALKKIGRDDQNSVFVMSPVRLGLCFIAFSLSLALSVWSFPPHPCHGGQMIA